MRRAVVVITNHPGIRASRKALGGQDARVSFADHSLGAMMLCAARPVDAVIVHTRWDRLIEKIAAAFPAMPIIHAEGADIAALRERIAEALASPASRKQPTTEKVLAAGGGERRSA